MHLTMLRPSHCPLKTPSLVTASTSVLFHHSVHLQPPPDCYILQLPHHHGRSACCCSQFRPPAAAAYPFGSDAERVRLSERRMSVSPTACLSLSVTSLPPLMSLGIRPRNLVRKHSCTPQVLTHTDTRRNLIRIRIRVR